MKPDIIHDYLRRAEMNEAQATALSHIFGEMATRSDVVRLDDRMESFQRRMDERFDAFEVRMDDRFNAFEARMDDRFNAFEARMDERFTAFEARMDERFTAFEDKIELRFQSFESRLDDRMDRKLAAMQTDLTWKLVGLVSLIVTIGTALNIFVG